MDPTPPPPYDPTVTAPPPPRAFTQGVGTVYQFVGVSLFLLSMAVCCGSSLLSKNVAQRNNLTAIGWTISWPGGQGLYSAQRAISVSMVLAVFFGIALAGIGLGLQAQARTAPYGAIGVTAFATLFWTVQGVFFAGTIGSIPLVLTMAALAVAFAILTGFALAAGREMWRDPPPPEHEVLPADYKVPYSHLHQDPPEVRLARDLEQRRERLAVQQKELEMLEERLRRKLDARPGESE